MCLAYLTLSVVTYPRKIVADKLFICSYLIFIWYYNFKHRQIGKICVVVVVVSLGVRSLCKATTGTRELSRWCQHFANASFKSTHRIWSFGKSAFFYWPNFLFLFGWKGKKQWREIKVFKRPQLNSAIVNVMRNTCALPAVTRLASFKWGFSALLCFISFPSECLWIVGFTLWSPQRETCTCGVQLMGCPRSPN